KAALLVTHRQRAYMIEQVPVAFELGDARVDRETVRGRTRDLTPPRPRTFDARCRRVRDALVWTELSIHRGVGEVVEIAALEDPRSFDKVGKVYGPDRTVEAHHVVGEFRHVAVRIAPDQPARAVGLGPHGRIDVVPVVRPLGILVADERAALGVA